MNLALLFAITLVYLHAPNGQLLEVNPAEVSTLRAPLGGDHQHWGRGTKCIIVMANGLFNATAEDCPTVEKILREAQ